MYMGYFELKKVKHLDLVKFEVFTKINSLSPRLAIVRC